LWWADLVKLTILCGDGHVEAQLQTINAPGLSCPDRRAILVLTEMILNGKPGHRRVREALRRPGQEAPGLDGRLVSTRSLVDDHGDPGADEESLAFTAGAYMESKAGKLVQQC
jgi:hypothetical protein